MGQAGRPANIEKDMRIHPRFPESKYLEIQSVARKLGVSCSALCRMAVYEFLKKKAA